MSFNIEHIKNKIKRVIIQIHHNKNKLGRNSHIIDKRDQKKPLLTLRYYGTPAAEYEDNQYQFESFSDRILAIDEQKEQIEDQEEVHQLQENTLHHSNEDEQHQMMLEQQRYLEDSIRNNIHYLEKDPKPRRKYWLFGKLLSSIHTSKDPVKSTNKSTADIMIISQSTMPSALPLENEPQDEENDDENDSCLERTQPITPPIYQDRNEFHQVNSYISLNTIRNSSFERKNLRSNSSLINLSSSIINKEQKCSRGIGDKVYKPTEPWKIILNDISLQAALLSTGSKLALNSNSYSSNNNIVADFTTSKHQDQQTLKDSDWITFKPIPDNLAKLSILNDENIVLESDLLDLTSNSSYHNFKTEDENSQSSSCMNNLILDGLNNNGRIPFDQQTKISILSDLVTNQTFKALETSAAYDGVFQDYNYSDDSNEYETQTELNKSTQSLIKDTKPLSIRSARRSKRIF